MKPHDETFGTNTDRIKVSYPTAPISKFNILMSSSLSESVSLETFSSPPGETVMQEHAGWRLALNDDSSPLSICVKDKNGHITSTLLSSDEALLLSPRQQSSWSWTQLAKCHVVELPHSYLDQLAKQNFGKLEKSHVGLLHLRAPRLVESIGLAHSSLTRSKSGCHFVAKGFIDASAFRLLRAMDESVLSKSSFGTLNAPQNASHELPYSIAEVLSRIRRKPEQTVTLDDLVKATGFSRSRLIRVFKSATGETPMAHLRRVRAETALSRLQSTRRSVADIATECGFYDQAHMTRVMKSILGRTPGSLR